MIKIRLPHIHRYRTTDIELEQPVRCVTTNQHISDGDGKLYFDVENKKCRCGKEKKVLINMYFATARYLPLNDKLMSIQLVNKQSII